MSSLTNYFNRQAYQPQYFIGDRVFGHWNGIPFIGSVGNDSVVSLEQGPRVSVQLDLPIKYKDQIHHVVFVKHRAIKALKEF